MKRRETHTVDDIDNIFAILVGVGQALSFEFVFLVVEHHYKFHIPSLLIFIVRSMYCRRVPSNLKKKQLGW